MAGEADYVQSFGLQWTRHAGTQLDSVSGMGLSEERFFDTTRWPRRMAGQRILEAGCGAGRFTEVVCKTGARVVAFDASEAVQANRANNRHVRNLTILRADIYNPPLRPESFDKIFCLGVLQHTPDPEKAFQSLVRFLKPGGEIVADVYRKDLVGLLQWKYLLRPITKRMRPQTLYKLVSRVVPPLIPATAMLKQLAGRAGARLSPIAEFSHLGVPAPLNREWAILDTFDMYSPAHDHPQSTKTVRAWLSKTGLVGTVARGSNGIILRGMLPARRGTNDSSGATLS